ncbi:MAG: hypothetical protein H6Q34_1136, partial [Deltaproteobacteria bacterium]|nr:hypothetical protein [Deltaproteobacteria bacterium]
VEDELVTLGIDVPIVIWKVFC